MQIREVYGIIQELCVTKASLKTYIIRYKSKRQLQKRESRQKRKKEG